MASSTSSFSNLLPNPTSVISQPKPKPKPTTLSLTATTTNQIKQDASSEPPARKLKGSSQLNRWSRARAIRSGRKLDRSVQRTQTWELEPPTQRESDLSGQSVGIVNGEEEMGKSIYMVSDGTGWTAEHSVNAALGQFDYCLVDRGCPVNTHLFSGVSLSF